MRTMTPERLRLRRRSRQENAANRAAQLDKAAQLEERQVILMRIENEEIARNGAFIDFSIKMACLIIIVFSFLLVYF